jgi:hypothetical protein
MNTFERGLFFDENLILCLILEQYQRVDFLVYITLLELLTKVSDNHHLYHV